MINSQKTKAKVDMLSQKASMKIGVFFGVKIKYPLKVVTSWVGVMGAGLLPWAISGIRKTIIVKFPEITEQQLSHEMSHWTLKKMTNQDIPLWFDEGLACYLSDMKFVGSSEELRKSGGQVRVTEMVSWIGFRGKTRWIAEMYLKRNTKLIYGISYYMVSGLVDKYGLGKLRNFVRKLKSSGFEQAFIGEFGMGTGKYYDKFLKSLNIKH